jgi:hypothetical protein
MSTHPPGAKGEQACSLARRRMGEVIIGGVTKLTESLREEMTL